MTVPTSISAPPLLNEAVSPPRPPPSARPFAEVPAEELYRAPPSVRGGLRVVDFGARVVKKGVVCAGVDVRLHLLAVLAQLRFQFAHRVGRHGLILLREEAEHGRA